MSPSFECLDETNDSHGGLASTPPIDELGMAKWEQKWSSYPPWHGEPLDSDHRGAPISPQQLVHHHWSKPTRHPPLLLSIPSSKDTSHAPQPQIDSFQPVTPETPVSLSSPISGVIDLTRSIKTLNDSPVTTGGYSDIYRGEWTKESWSEDGRGVNRETVLVAIKLLRILAVGDQDNVKARKRLNREVYVWHRLEHPNIVKLFGTSYHMSERPSMVMRWYKNGSADEYLREHNCSYTDRMRLVLDVTNGLKYLHTLTPPIVHGDLKGNNVLITDDGSAVLSDFGLSQVIEELLDGPTGFTPSNPQFAPPRWQAPELLEDECLPGLETDVWSFGCTAYQLLTGNIPYHYRSRDGMVIKDMQQGTKPPGRDGLAIVGSDGRIEDVLNNHCWSFDPSDRLQMVDIADHIESICNHNEH